MYQAQPIAYSGNYHTSNTFTQPPKTLGKSRAPESAIYADRTYGLKYGPKSVYQIPWPFPVYSTTAEPNADMTYMDPGRPQTAYKDTGDFKDKEEVFIGGIVPTSAGLPLFDPTKSRFKFKRAYEKIR